jgi:hypothetical protein
MLDMWRTTLMNVTSIDEIPGALRELEKTYAGDGERFEPDGEAILQALEHIMSQLGFEFPDPDSASIEEVANYIVNGLRDTGLLTEEMLQGALTFMMGAPSVRDIPIMLME